MTTLTIRNLDASLKDRLRARAARHGVSMQEEARVILRQELADEASAHQDDKPSEREVQQGGKWRSKPSVEDLMKLSIKPDKPFDQKAVSDELYAYLDNE